MKTKFASKVNPFTGQSVTKLTSVNTSALKVESMPYPGMKRNTGSKYEEVFTKLKPGQCVVCSPDDTNRISAALRKYHENRNAHPIVRSIAKCEDGKGRVWLIRADQKLKAAA